MANLAGKVDSLSLRQSAGADYGRALQLTNAALRDPATAVQDETLAAICLLGLYEVCAPTLSAGMV
jgi:hypothetical protein